MCEGQVRMVKVQSCFLPNPRSNFIEYCPFSDNHLDSILANQVD